MSDAELEVGRRPADLISGMAGVVILFLAIYLLGIAVLSSFLAADVDPGTDPTDPQLSIVLVGALLVMSALMLVVFRRGLGWVLRGFVALVSMGLTWIVFGTLVPRISVGGVHAPAVALTILTGVALLAFPRWWVIDLVGIVLGAGAIALFGLSVGPLPAIVLLVLLAIYDAISVYGTGHMLSLAEGAMSSRLPVMLLVPTSLDSALEDPGLEDDAVVVIGLGDVIVPGMLVGAAIAHGPGSPIAMAGLPVTPAAIGTIVGILAGVIVLFVVLGRRGPQPGLPFLNAGALAGFFVGALVDGAGPTAAIGLEMVLIGLVG